MSKSSASDPDNFNHDFAIMGVTPEKKLTIDSGLLGLNADDGFSAKIYVHAIEEATDTLLYSQVNITMLYSNASSGTLSLLGSLAASCFALTAIVAV